MRGTRGEDFMLAIQHAASPSYTPNFRFQTSLMLLRIIATVAGVLLAGVAFGQDAATRAGEAERQRADKAAQLKPRPPNKVEAVLFRIEDHYLPERIFNPPRGLFVRAGGMSEGQGIKAGPAFRLSNYDTSFTATSVVSIRGAWEVTGRLDFPRPTLEPPPRYFSVGAVRHRLPQEDFWGFGIDAPEEARTNYLLDETTVDVTAGLNPTDWLAFSAAAEYRAERPGAGKDPNFPSTGLIDSDVPGITDDVDYVRMGGGVGLDLRVAREGTPVGGWYNVSFNRYVDQTLDRFSFNRLDADVQQYIPIFTSARLIALHAHLTSTVPDEGHAVPIYMQPTIGGSHSVRGYRVSRFRDQNSLLLQAEYRYQLNAFMTGSLFYDAGTVAAERHKLNLHDTKTDYGFALRFGFAALIGMRAEIVLGGDEGTVYALRFGDVF